MPARVDIDCASHAEGVPPPSRIRRWVRAALPAERAGAELCVRIVDEAESRRLNRRYRRRDKPTNVLAFQAQLPAGVAPELLGDIVICAPLVEREAHRQRKPPGDHWAHLLVHGTLHLLGYDHEQPRDAQQMEAREREILAGLKIPDPYASEGESVGR